MNPYPNLKVFSFVFTSFVWDTYRVLNHKAYRERLIRVSWDSFLRRTEFSLYLEKGSREQILKFREAFGRGGTQKVFITPALLRLHGITWDSLFLTPHTKESFDLLHDMLDLEVNHAHRDKLPTIKALYRDPQHWRREAMNLSPIVWQSE